MSEHTFGPTGELEDGPATVNEGDRIRIKGWQGGDVVVVVTKVGEHGELTVEEVGPDER